MKCDRQYIKVERITRKMNRNEPSSIEMTCNQETALIVARGYQTE
jgi:hypothetical protein